MTMAKGRAMEHEEMVIRIRQLIAEEKDFFVGGRGIGIECKKMSVCWFVKIERAAFIAYPDQLVCEHDALKLYYESGEPFWVAEFKLEHYLKVKEI